MTKIMFAKHMKTIIKRFISVFLSIGLLVGVCLSLAGCISELDSATPNTSESASVTPSTPEVDSATPNTSDLEPASPSTPESKIDSSNDDSLGVIHLDKQFTLRYQNGTTNVCIQKDYTKFLKTVTLSDGTVEMVLYIKNLQTSIWEKYYKVDEIYWTFEKELGTDTYSVLVELLHLSLQYAENPESFIYMNDCTAWGMPCKRYERSYYDDIWRQTFTHKYIVYNGLVFSDTYYTSGNYTFSSVNFTITRYTNSADLSAYTP